MAKPGPKPLPTNLVALFGGKLPTVPTSQGEQVLEPQVPPPPDGELVPSASLSLEAKEYFEFYAAHVARGHLKPLDVPLLERLCQSQVLFDQTLEKYAGQPLVQTNMANMDVKSPYFDMLTRLAELIRKLSIELALTPTERNRIKASGDPVDREKEAKMAQLRHKYLPPVAG